MIKKYIKNQYLLRAIYNAINAYSAQKQYWLYKKDLKKIRSLKDVYNGKRCFIVGTGPSLTISDLELLKDEYTFGTNRIYELFSMTEWRPTFYVNQDADLIRKFTAQIKSVKSQHKFLPIDFKNLFDGDDILYFILKHKDFYPKQAPFSNNVSRFLCQGFTVTYGAIQIAAYLGFKEIYLLGVDHNYSVIRGSDGKPVVNSSTTNNYSSGMKEYKNPKNLPRLLETTISFETAETISRKRGFRIFNATRGGHLECFERVKLEDVL